jgi:hypothetical protein
MDNESEITLLIIILNYILHLDRFYVKEIIIIFKHYND